MIRVCCAAISLVVIIGATFLTACNKPPAGWEQVAAVAVHAESKHIAMCLYTVPPHWFHIAVLLHEQHEHTTHWMEARTPNTTLAIATVDTVRGGNC